MVQPTIDGGVVLCLTERYSLYRENRYFLLCLLLAVCLLYTGKLVMRGPHLYILYYLFFFVLFHLA